MTRKEAIEIVVANVKMGWPTNDWCCVLVFKNAIEFNRSGGRNPCAQAHGSAFQGRSYHTWWQLSRKWLEEKGYL